MAVAALLADAVRAQLCPLRFDTLPGNGQLALHGSLTPLTQRGAAVLVGAGGIGVYAATLLAARRHGLLVVDFDCVEESNRNRQGLFTSQDASERMNKALGVRRRLRELFPRSRVLALARRVDLGFQSTIRRIRPCPGALLSAVDNAQSRLAIQDLGERSQIPVVQAGTALYCADCFTQLPGGPLLDDQMHGVLSSASRAEQQARARTGRCALDPSYVVPGMLAGAMLAFRFEQLTQANRDHSLPPIRWRQGGLPCETRNLSDEISTQIGSERDVIPR
jgi:hypothetical protein